MKKVPLTTLGIIGMIGAPGLWIESSFYDVVHHQDTVIGGVFDLLYMLGWTCSIYGLLQLSAAGFKGISKAILYIQLGLLTISNIWNIWEIIDPVSNHPLYHVLGMFWPTSNVFMIVTGIAVIAAKRLPGYQRFIPLVAGLWLPATFAGFSLLRNETAGFYFMNIYSLVAWFMMGSIIFRNGFTKTIVQKKKHSAYTNAWAWQVEGEVEATYL